MEPYAILLWSLVGAGAVQLGLWATDRSAVERMAKRLPYDLLADDSELLESEIASRINGAIGREKVHREFLDRLSRIVLVTCIGSLAELTLRRSATSISHFPGTLQLRPSAFGFGFLLVFSIPDADAFARRVALLRFGVAGLPPRVRAYLMSPFWPTWMSVAMLSGVYVLLQVLSVDFTGVSPNGLSSKDWYIPWVLVRPFEAVETICVAERAQKGTGRRGAVTSREQWAVAVRFRDGGYWTSIRSKRGEPETDVQRAAEYIAEKSGVAITKTETVWLDESPEANAKRAKKGIVRSPCAARESLVGVGAGVGGRVRVAAGMRVR